MFAAGWGRRALTCKHSLDTSKAGRESSGGSLTGSLVAEPRKPQMRLEIAGKMMGMIKSKVRGDFSFLFQRAL